MCNGLGEDGGDEKGLRGGQGGRTTGRRKVDLTEKVDEEESKKTMGDDDDDEWTRVEVRKKKRKKAEPPLLLLPRPTLRQWTIGRNVAVGNVVP